MMNCAKKYCSTVWFQFRTNGFSIKDSSLKKLCNYNQITQYLIKADRSVFFMAVLECDQICCVLQSNKIGNSNRISWVSFPLMGRPLEKAPAQQKNKKAQ